MFFDDLIPKEIDKYGVGVTAGKGRCHFMASLAEEDKVRQLCLSRHQELNGLPGRPVKWFDSESCAVQVFRNNKKACHKCLRTIETIELSLAGGD